MCKIDVILLFTNFAQPIASCFETKTKEECAYCFSPKKKKKKLSTKAGETALSGKLYFYLYFKAPENEDWNLIVAKTFVSPNVSPFSMETGSELFKNYIVVVVICRTIYGKRKLKKR